MLLNHNDGRILYQSLSVLHEVVKSVCFISERELTFTFAICRRPSVCLSVCLSVVCNVGAPYSDDWNFPQCFYAVWCVGHPLTLR